MKNFRKISLGLMVLAAVVVAPVIAGAYSYLAWGAMSEKHSFSVTTYFSEAFNTIPSLGSVSFTLGYGLTDRLDIYWDPTYNYIMPRWDILGKNLAILAFSVGATPGIQFHGAWDTLDRFGLVYNVYYTTAGWDFSGSDVSFLLTPVLKLDNWGLWVEGQANTVVNSFAYQLGAGVYAFLGETMLSVGVIDITSQSLAGIGIGAWLWVPISFK